MVAFTRFDDALAHADECTALDLDLGQGAAPAAQLARLKNLVSLSLRGCPERLQVPEAVARLPGLKHLRLCAGGDRVRLPKAFQRLKLESLELLDGDVRDVLPLRSLRRLHVAVKDPKADVALLARHLPALVHLELRGLAAGRGRAASRDRALQEAGGPRPRLVRPGRPPARARAPAQAPHAAPARPADDGRPRGGAPAPGPARAAAARAARRPAGWLADLPRLLDLDLGAALNGGTTAAADDTAAGGPAAAAGGAGPDGGPAAARPRPLRRDLAGGDRAAAPAALALPGVRGHRELRALHAFPELEELSLQSCHRLHDLAPLAALPRLRSLNLQGCGVVDLTPLLSMEGLEELDLRQTRARDLSPAFLHPGLRVLRADGEARERWEAGDGAPDAGAESPKALRKSLTSDDPARAEEALLQLARYVERRSSRERNAVWEVFGLDPAGLDGEGMVALPELDALLLRHRKALSSDALAAAVECTMRRITESPLAPATAVEEIVARRDVPAQERVVRAFQRACGAHDAGHRLRGDTLQDRLVDELFPQFEPGPLAELLCRCGADALNHEGGDGMDELFKPAFARARGRKLRARLVAAFRRYHEEASPVLHASYFARLVEQIGAPELRPLARSVARAAAQAEQVALDLKAPSPRAAEKRLRQLGTRAVPEALFVKLRSAFDAAAGRPDVRREAKLHYLGFLLGRARDGRAVTLLLSLAKEDFRGLAVALSALARSAPRRRAIVEALRAATAREIDRNLRSLLRELTARLARVTVADELRAQARELLGRLDGEAHFAAAIDALRSLPEPLALEPAEGARFAAAVANLCGSRRYEKVCAVFAQLPKVQLDPDSFQRVLAQAVPAARLGRDLELEARCWSVAPAARKVRLDLLAYNLASLSAVKQRRPELLGYARRAVELGKTRAQFFQDTDFAAYLKDADFLAAIADG
jgi:hypothetical protein